MISKNNTQYFDTLGDKFDAYMSNYDVERRIELIFNNLIKESSLKELEILEVGCGTGKISEIIVKLGGILTVLDIGKSLVSNVSERLSCKGIVGDACQLPFDDETFEIIISSECIEHTLNPRHAIKEMCRVCKRGGYVCLTTPNKLWYPLLLISQNIGLRKFSGIENWIFPYEASNVMRKSGMENILFSGCHLWPFQIRFLRPLLRRIDTLGKLLYPFMINFGIIGKKQNK
jgi:ubiquinone/menaquinone biosynthesis C-methylase UbiE